MRNRFISDNERLYLGKRRCKNDIGEENKRAWLEVLRQNCRLKSPHLECSAKKNKKSKQNGNNHGLKK